jgi:hypothetical protein
MDSRGKKEFAALLLTTLEIYGKPEPSEVALKMWYAMLKRYDISRIKEAFKHHIETSRFPPTPADIINRIEGSEDSKALRAWAAVTRAIREHSSYESVKFDDPAIHWAIEKLGGWIYLCTILDTRNERFVMSDFSKLYTSVRGKVDWDMVQPYLVGKIEMDNRSTGHTVDMLGNSTIPEPKLIETGGGPHDSKQIEGPKESLKDEL